MNKFTDFKIGDEVDFYALLESLQKRFTPNKSGYYGAVLCDGDTSVDARIWDCNLIESNNINQGNVYLMHARVNEYANKIQYVITHIKPVEPGEIDITSFYRQAPMPKEEINRGIKFYLKKIKNKIFYNLAVQLIANNAQKYFEYPAAVSMHHNYLYGLGYHTLTMLRLAEKLLELYPGMNSDLLYCGIIIHDIGKTKELSNSTSPVYTEEGNLLGHIVIGLQMLAVEADKQGVSDTEEFKVLSHLVASHHGELDFGSPKEPGMMEAWALHLVDLTDSKMAAMTVEAVKTEKGQYSASIGSIGRKPIYKADIKEEM